MPGVYLVHLSFYYSKRLGALGFCSVISLRCICWSEQGCGHAAKLLARGWFWFTGLSEGPDAKRSTAAWPVHRPWSPSMSLSAPIFAFYFSCCYFFHCNRNVCHISGNLGRQKAICCSFSSFQRTTTSLFFSHDMSHRRNLPMSGLQTNNKSGMVISQGQFTTFSLQLMLT